MSKNNLGVEVPAGTDAFDPAGDMVELGASLAGRLIIPVSNSTQRQQALADIGSSTLSPLYVNQADTSQLWRHDGTNWRAIFSGSYNQDVGTSTITSTNGAVNDGTKSLAVTGIRPAKFFITAKGFVQNTAPALVNVSLTLYVSAGTLDNQLVTVPPGYNVPWSLAQVYDGTNVGTFQTYVNAQWTGTPGAGAITTQWNKILVVSA